MDGTNRASNSSSLTPQPTASNDKSTENEGLFRSCPVTHTPGVIKLIKLEPSKEKIDIPPLTERLCEFKKPDGCNEYTKFKLMEQYIEGRTENFTNNDWLYLIIKMGKRRLPFMSNKRALLKKMHGIYGEVFMEKRSELNISRLKLEAELMKQKGGRRRKLSKQLLKRIPVPDTILQEIISKTKKGEFIYKNTSTKKLSSPESIFDISHNDFFSWLVIACNNNNQFSPPEVDAWAQIEKKIKEDFDHSVFNINKKVGLLLSTARMPESICGGRTLQVTEDGSTYYIKFIRDGEEPMEFIREKSMHEALHEPSYENKFKSEIPVSQGLFKYPYNSEFEQFDDRIKIHTDIDGSKYVQGYCFRASPDYAVYAWNQDDAHPDKIHEASENGFKAAAFDIGAFARQGLTFDGLIPIQHSTNNQGRKWLSLSGVFGDDNFAHTINYDRNPGIMLKWLSSGTNRPDIGRSGLRDFGDSTFINDITDESAIFKEFGIRKTSHFEKTRNSLVFFNALLDNFVAIFILYGRLHQQDKSYHYHNPQAISELKAFIESIMGNFLQGYYDNPEAELKKTMEINDSDYEEWLTRTATEIIYWTAAQPKYIDGKEIPAFKTKTGEFDHENQCYVKHIIKNKYIDDKLYPTETNAFSLRDTLDRDGNLYLGLDLCTFPFTALLKGIPYLFTKIIKNSSNPDL